MGYGREKADINENSIIQQQKKDFKEVPQDIIDFEELYVIEANAAFTHAFYEENPHLYHEGISDVEVVDKRQAMRLDGYILINQSLIKKVIDKHQNEIPFCPAYLKHDVIDKKGKDRGSDAMMCGKFFESMTLGGTTGGNLVTDLPRKTVSKKRENELRSKGLPIIGEKRIDQERIEIQIERFKIRAQQLGAHIATGINTHVQIFKHWDGKKYLIVGELDLFPTAIQYNGTNRLAIVDVKLTSNVETTFGDFCWGTPQFMDHLQADMYHYLVRDIDFTLNPHLKDVVTPEIQDIIKHNEILFLYWIWGYQKEPLELQEKIVERSYFDQNGMNYRQKELQERIRKAIAIIEREEAFNWDATPIQSNCKVCSLNRSNGGNCGLSINSVI